MTCDDIHCFSTCFAERSNYAFLDLLIGTTIALTAMGQDRRWTCCHVLYGEGLPNNTKAFSWSTSTPSVPSFFSTYDAELGSRVG